MSHRPGGPRRADPPAEPDGDPRAARLSAQLAMLHEVGRGLGGLDDARAVVARALAALPVAGGFRFALAGLVEPDTDRLEACVASVAEAEATGRAALGAPAWGRSYRTDEGVIGVALASGAAVVVPRVAEEPRFLGRLGLHDPALPFLAVPIVQADGAVIGVLAAQPADPAVAADPEPALSDALRFLELVSGLIGQAVRLGRERTEAADQARAARDGARRAARDRHGLGNLVGHTPAMRTVFETVRLVAKWKTTVLIRGESGTGKELIANAIHYNSPRASGPFVKLNCAALPDTLLESELFGHERGAFTGAIASRKGRFEQGDGGTLFLDEIGEISPAFQAKLLRVLQEGEFERIGSSKTVRTDIRIIAATNKDLGTAVADGRFREDLFYRLNVMPIRLPPLRERLEDIPALTQFLVDRIAELQGRRLTVTDSALRLLARQSWPGNVRELENCLERAAIFSEGGTIDRDVLGRAGLTEAPPEATPDGDPRAARPRVDLSDPGLDERERLIAALEEAGWVQAKAARLLNMTPRQIAYRIQTLNIKMRQI